MAEISNEEPSFFSLKVEGADGKEVLLSELTKGRTVVAFLRHFGCPLCWEFGHTLALQRPILERAGYK